jgi:hypothetical protein
MKARAGADKERRLGNNPEHDAVRHAIFLAAGLLLLSGRANAQMCEKAIDSYLYDPSYCLDEVIRGKPRAYVPQPGDVMLATDKNKFWKVTHDLALAFEPHNSAIIVQRYDGSLGILEAGPNDTIWVKISPLLPHLKEYADKGPVWIRKRHTPLTAEQNACLTDWAERQYGKRFALGRLALQLTPFRDRGPFRTEFMGKPHGDRNSFFCSELVMESCVTAGLVDRETARPSATYPHDLFFDHSHNRYISKHVPLIHDWDPPARWLYFVVAEPKQ